MGGGCLLVEVGELEGMDRRVVQDDLSGDGEVFVDVDQFAGLELLPSGVFVHSFAGDDDGGVAGEFAGPGADGAGAAGVVEMPVAVRPTGSALQHQQVVGVGVAQRPQLGGCGEDEVDRVER